MPGQEQPRFFIDRNMGFRIVPGGLRKRGWLLTTMDERYGKERSQQIDDVDWIADASALGECLLTGDAGIAHRPAEAAVIWMTEAKAFVPGRNSATGPAQLERLVAEEGAIMRWALRASGPFVLNVEAGRLRRLRINYPRAGGDERSGG
ncbi:MAG: hypothetical protein LBK95_21000 [Bifidobacteriaceae bacterium]|jgi:hypothetical protein|nr:hypothetical protein [Bifidobacteriaceae bacterium]